MPGYLLLPIFSLSKIKIQIKYFHIFLNYFKVGANLPFNARPWFFDDGGLMSTLEPGVYLDW